MDNQQQNNSPKKQRRLVKTLLRRFAVLLLAVVVLLGAAWGITAYVQNAYVDDLTNVNSQDPFSVTIVDPAQPEEPQNEDGWNFIGPVEQTINDMQLLEPDSRMIALPANGRVEMSYFDTVTFVGDSLTQGLEIYKDAGIPNAHYCAYRGVGPKQIYDGSLQTREDGEQEVPMDALLASSPSNVYILLGANAMASNLSDEAILTYYAEMLVQIKANLPQGTGIYIQSITTVRPDNRNGFELSRIQMLNNELARMAWDNDVYYVDLNEVLAGDDGYLLEEYAGSDGLHLSPAGYVAWVEYLVTHTVYSPANPYVEGSL